jgi:hypothetical protein
MFNPASLFTLALAKAVQLGLQRVAIVIYSSIKENVSVLGVYE